MTCGTDMICDMACSVSFFLECTCCLLVSSLNLYIYNDL